MRKYKRIKIHYIITIYITVNVTHTQIDNNLFCR